MSYMWHSIPSCHSMTYELFGDLFSFCNRFRAYHRLPHVPKEGHGSPGLLRGRAAWLPSGHVIDHIMGGLSVTIQSDLEGFGITVRMSGCV